MLLKVPESPASVMTRLQQVVEGQRGMDGGHMKLEIYKPFGSAQGLVVAVPVLLTCFPAHLAITWRPVPSVIRRSRGGSGMPLSSQAAPCWLCRRFHADATMSSLPLCRELGVTGGARCLA